MTRMTFTVAGVNDWPPLMHAVHKNQRETAIVLLDGGAKIDAAALSSTRAFARVMP